jgi:hypothetical protein
MAEYESLSHSKWEHDNSLKWPSVCPIAEALSAAFSSNKEPLILLRPRIELFVIARAVE